MNVHWGYISVSVVPSDETVLEKTTDNSTLDETVLEKTTDFNFHKYFLWKAGGT